MRQVIFIFFLVILFPSLALSQANFDMKEEFYYGIKMFVIPKKSISKYISEHKGKLDDALSREYRIETYTFPDKSYLYDFRSHAFLFTSKEDLVRFNNVSKEVSAKELALQSDNSFDEKFISGTETLISEFEKRFSLKLEFGNLNDLKKLDHLINTSNSKGVFGQQWKAHIVAIVGKFIIAQLKGGVWALSNMGNQRLICIVDSDLKQYNPLRVVDKELNYYLKEEGEVAFYDDVQIELIHHEAINKLIK